MLDGRIRLSTADAMTVPADAVVVEDSGWLTGARGPAAIVDALAPDLRQRREAALAQHGGPYPLGSALSFPLQHPTSSLRHAIWAITFSYQMQPEQRNQLVRATPLDVAAATRSALLQAAELPVTHLVMPAIGTRMEHHVLPPAPKKLPRYVMGAAQLIALHTTLQAITTIEQVTLSLSQRDYAIFHDLLGQALDLSFHKDNDDD
jgi:O-acetyl-ADP-ribose deacetylase (regulator of RNase III)